MDKKKEVDRAKAKAQRKKERDELYDDDVNTKSAYEMAQAAEDADDQVEISAFTKEKGKYVVVVDGREQIEVANGTKIFVKKSSETLNIVSTEIENKSINHITKAFNGYIKYY